MFKSTDGGATWQAASEGLTSFNVQTLALDPGAPDTVYAGTYGGGVFKSTDGGATWQAYNEGLAADTRVLALAMAPHASSTVYRKPKMSLDIAFIESYPKWERAYHERRTDQPIFDRNDKIQPESI